MASSAVMACSSFCGVPKARTSRHAAISSRSANGGWGALRLVQGGQAAGQRSRTGPVVTRAMFRKKQSAPALETVIPDPDYRIAGVTAATAAALVASEHPVAAVVPGVLAAFFAFQATNVKFVFGPDALEVRIGAELEETDNVIVGGANKWSYDTFTNWEFWWPGFPVLVYFKETQTKPEGQIHFFPLLFNGQQVYDAMVERCGPSMNSGPKDEED